MPPLQNLSGLTPVDPGTMVVHSLGRMEQTLSDHRQECLRLIREEQDKLVAHKNTVLIMVLSDSVRVTHQMAELYRRLGQIERIARG